ncbi:chromate efflux transporter [Halomonas sp. McH1-25]|uniref:chromate efflux transporter n=1 Tax=unclassified Halomonas TaxID=2609666 RepID=UPI001EF57B4E|nr:MULTISPECIES: chromate efflux transporter [unclassified Halomonas]MCG7601361.1 chromate efflux transporter [Halomonas sp. McH1-25]MCP1343505.1 chromate efflux transporter [Halomonas sp. FL8]MCP1361164.1 chromate efflux transporter [Halomonas sp. BBD45]
MPIASIFTEFFKLGCMSFGGPAAHMSYFHRRFVDEIRWVEARDYAELMALCQFLPGPASSQMGMAIGYRRAGVSGSLAAFFGFTLPSALLMLVAGLWLAQAEMNEITNAALHGLKLLAVAVVADAVVKLYATACPDRPRQGIALLTAAAVWLWPGMAAQLAAIALAAMIGALRPIEASPQRGSSQTLSRLGFLFLAVFVSLLLLLPWLDAEGKLAVFDAFYRAGALVFGGGHVVLPLLDAQPLIRDGMSEDTFLAGYSLAQAVPGPMFSFAAYLGSALDGSLLSGLVALVAIFLPGWLLLMAILPIWARLRQNPRLAGALAWVVAATVGLLLAALYTPVFVSAVTGPAAMAIVVFLWALLRLARLPLWGVVIIAPLAGLALTELGMA